MSESRPRLLSLDALRGFDMFWIIGGAELIAALAPRLDWRWLSWLDEQTGTHVPWEGFVFWDLVFPLFLFISGATLAFSYGNQPPQEQRADLLRRALRRGLTLVVLGFIYNGLLELDWETMRYPSVLGRIGLAWMGAAWIWILCSTRGRVLWFLGLLLGYWGLLMWVPAPGSAAGDLSMEGNIVSWLDRQIIPGRLHRGIHDPEGLLGTLPAIGTALLGAWGGQWLRTERPDLVKFLGLVGGAVLCLAVGHVWNDLLPFNKNLWTSSFVLWCAGWSFALLAVFYLLADVLKLGRLFFPFVVIGLNPITIYLLQRGLVDFYKPVQFLAGGSIDLAPSHIQGLLTVGLVLLTKWGVLYFLFRQRIFLKV